MSDDVNADFERLHGVAQIGHSGFNAAGQHPVFSAAHSFFLAHKYGKEDPGTYLRNPGLRRMDTRQAALEGLQSAGAGVRRYSDRFAALPQPFDMSTVTTATSPTTVPTSPGAYQYKPRTYSARMTPPGMP
jgi:hypothetical protein